MRSVNLAQASQLFGNALPFWIGFESSFFQARITSLGSIVHNLLQVSCMISRNSVCWSNRLSVVNLAVRILIKELNFLFSVHFVLLFFVVESKDDTAVFDFSFLM